MLETKTKGIRLPKGLSAGRLSNWALAGALAMLATAGTVQAAAQTSKIGPAAPVTYDNKWEIFGGLNFQNFQAGQSLPKRMNLGGGEVLGTYWITPKLGLGAEWRGDWGTTPIMPNPYFNGRALVSLNGGLLGAQYRGPKNQYAALNYHAYFGASHGDFTHSTGHFPPQFLPTTGLYTNRTKPIAALGGSVDFNFKKNFAFRLSPDLILEHFGSETREFIGISGGVVWRIGKRQSR
ncbi:hypothetical protein [Edaphobacter bradus]|uniref:hypothetical protein n=1 Tax=Edaphobacter bradus TaxID=2259016 RepID=UPI0021DFBB69|nr:hypothetical protein [Edaphobacter bradus]